ncbi:hypothetical protein WR25_25822 [Diploscapter pachys]|uniref:Uncharacterized protein n=1 Tax=Diploscapter pachys TaxID=2018661 RepID=A0A2A2K665_9BILA|nr:hypothetical protein WR25_25822 [Diploscapter pachys]
MRLVRRPMAPQVRHDHAKALGRNRGGMAVFDPIDLRRREIAMDQHDGPPLAQLAIGDAGAVEAGEILRMGRRKGQGSSSIGCERDPTWVAINRLSSTDRCRTVSQRPSPHRHPGLDPGSRYSRRALEAGPGSSLG